MSVPAGSRAGSHGAGAPVHTVIRGARVLTQDDARAVLDADVHLAGDRIAAVLPWGSPMPEGARVVEGGGCALLPGFVQTHIHLCQTLFRNWADDLALLDWLRQRVWPLEGAHDPDSLYASARLGVAELIRGGTTTVLDMGTVRYHDAVMQALEEMGLRAFSGKALMDHPSNPGCLRETTDEALQSSHDLAARWHGAGQGRLRYAFAPRFALSCTDAALREAARAAADGGMLFHTHASENPDEVAEVQARTGRRNLEYLHDVGALGPHCCVAHCIWLDDHERALLARTGTHVLHCPSSNLKLGSGICDVPKLLEAGVSVSLGADGAPCNNNLSALTELRLAALLQKPRYGPTAMPASEVLAMATRGGARALGLEAELGTVEVGKRADLVLVSLQGAHLGPAAPDPAAQIVYGARDEDVHSVWIDGALRLDAGALTSGETPHILAQARRELPKLLARAGLAP